jgi:hypothetical protein
MTTRYVMLGDGGHALSLRSEIPALDAISSMSRLSATDD